MVDLTTLCRRSHAPNRRANIDAQNSAALPVQTQKQGKPSLGPTFLILAWVAVATVGCSPAQEPSPPADPFTIIALPDTQTYCALFPEIYLAQTQWIRDQVDHLNIVGVVHEGDVTEHNVEKQWKRADTAMSVLDGVVPYCMNIGNHDLGSTGEDGRDTRLFNEHFGVERFQSEPWYGDHYGKGNENAFYLVDAAGMSFLILCLEFAPRDKVLAWADGVVWEHERHRVVLVTHCYMYNDDTRVSKTDRFGPHAYSWGGNNGDEIWDKFVRKHENIFLVLSGHITEPGVGRLTSTGDHGNRVHQILANYQSHENGGNGWLRIMRFEPARDKIVVTTYSPSLDDHARDERNEFQLDYPMP
jgi:hypothetical protein